MPQTADGLFLDLPHALPGESEFVTDFLKGHFWLINAEECLDDVALPLGESEQRKLNFVAELLHHKLVVCHRGVIVGKHIQQTVFLSVCKGGVY